MNLPVKNLKNEELKKILDDMLDQQNLGKLCPFSVSCPVYQEKLIVERVPPFLIRNVFCNRGQKGWNNCVRYKIAVGGLEVPATATPYKQF